jgi:nitroreductase
MMSELSFFETVRRRRSIRSFQSKPVEDEKLFKILETVDLAPSAGNLQAYEIVMVRDENRKRALAEAAWGQWFIAEAPVVFVVCANKRRSAVRYGSRGENLYSINDASIAATYLELAVAALGLGSCWVGAFRDDMVSKAIEAPSHIRPIAIIPIGYPAESPSRPPRRGFKDFLHFDKIRIGV